MRLIGALVCFLVAVAAGVYYYVPGAEMRRLPAPEAIDIGQSVPLYLEKREARFDDIVEGTKKRVVWAGEPGVRTDWAVIYLHGFSASSEEMRPVPEKVAQALGANIFYTRLQGHGRDAAAMGTATTAGWGRDIAEAIAVGDRIGDRILAISSSTGATLAAIAAADPVTSGRIDAHVMISPNFGPRNRASQVLTWPLAEWWVPLIGGKTRGFEPVNELHARYWTETYPTVATIPMQAAVVRARKLDLAAAAAPVLLIYSEADEVVRPAAIRAKMAEWRGPVTVMEIEPGEGIDPANHVLAGDILSPAATADVVARILDWMGGI